MANLKGLENILLDIKEDIGELKSSMKDNRTDHKEMKKHLKEQNGKVNANENAIIKLQTAATIYGSMLVPIVIALILKIFNKI